MDKTSNLACTPLTLTRGSAVEIVYRRSVELITSPPTPELPWLKPAAIPSGAQVLQDPGQSLLAAAFSEQGHAPAEQPVAA